MTNWFIQSRWTTSELKNSDRLFIFYVSNPLWLHHVTIATLFCLVKYLKITSAHSSSVIPPLQMEKTQRSYREACGSRCSGLLLPWWPCAGLFQPPPPSAHSPSTPGLCFSVSSPSWVSPHISKQPPYVFSGLTREGFPCHPMENSVCII